MKNLFNLLLILLCGTGCISAIVAETTETFFFGGVIMCLSAAVFIISCKLENHA